jgi:hypothetical protein
MNLKLMTLGYSRADTKFLFGHLFSVKSNDIQNLV